MSKTGKLLGKKRDADSMCDMLSTYFEHKHESKIKAAEDFAKNSLKSNIIAGDKEYFEKIGNKCIRDLIFGFLTLSECKDLYNNLGNKRLRPSFKTVIYK